MKSEINRIVDEVIQFMYNGHREFKFSNLKFIPKQHSLKVQDTLISKNLIEKAKRQPDSFADCYVLTQKAIEIILEHDSYLIYLEVTENKPNTFTNRFIDINPSDRVDFKFDKD